MRRTAAVPQTQRVEVAGEVGPLECVVELGGPQPRGLAVICHPHPLHGGSMTNKVVTTVARACARQGAVSVRFNFRGVGTSAGSHDGGDGELADALAVTDWAIAEFGNALPLLVGGFSFGGAIAYRAAAARPARALITIAPAVERIPAATAEPDCRWLLVQGAADEIIAPDSVTRWLDTRRRPPTQVWLPGVGHFFHGQLDALARAVSDFVTSAEAIG